MSLSQPCRVTACRSGSLLYWEEGDTWWAKTTTASGERHLGIGFLVSWRVLQLWLVVLKLDAVLQEKGTNVQHRLVHRKTAWPRRQLQLCRLSVRNVAGKAEQRFVYNLTRRDTKPKPKTFGSTQYGAAGRVRARTCSHIFNIHNHLPFAVHLLCTEANRIRDFFTALSTFTVGRDFLTLRNSF